ncbi:hypothetical protein PLESTB_001142800 [Pleodorina starrii]|uniref:Uncharacterized protein n=1 Tax=Pleodorina starrii TaxID=330485 RepID=A0A9W6F5S1_9CHLO|nr:hypothetical protein PLESTB_001142800 [Pleodorina starrii]
MVALTLSPYLSANAAGRVCRSSGIVRLFDAGSGAPFKSWELPGGHTPKGCLAFSQKNALEPLRLAAGADDGQVFVWDLSPVASGPVVVGMQQLRGRRVTGVGFGAYKKESVLVASSDLGQICVMNMQNYTSLQSNDVLSMDLKVGISSLAIRDDGQLLAVGTRDGRVGVIGFEALIHKKARGALSPQAFRVVDLGTGLSVTDVAFRSSRHTKDQSGENNANAAAAAPVPVGTALGPSAAQRIPLEDTTNSSGAKRRLLLDKQDANAARVATARPVAAAASQLQQPVAAATNIPLGATGNVASMRPTASSQLATPGGPASVAAPAGSGGAAASGPAGQPSVPRPLGSAQPQAAQRPAMPPLAIPGITQPIGQHKRQSDAGDGDNTGSSSTSPTGPQSMAEVAIGAGGQVLTSPVAQTAVAVPPSLSRPRGSNDSALTSSTAGLRSYLDDFRLEVRELVRGLAVDMVRHAIQAERAHQNGITLLRLENRVLQDEIESMRQGLAENLRFGLLGRQGAPWQ